MMKIIVTSLFVLMVVVQWFVPLSKISRQESVLKNGKVFRFKTEPIDPTDPFRGKYIVLQFEASTFPADTALHWTWGERAYVILDEDSAGFARIKDLLREPPENTTAYVRASAGYVHDDGHVQIEYPFERYYLEESKAPAAEELYRGSRADSTQVAYAEVFVENGNVALNDVKINGKSLLLILEEVNRDSQ